MDLRLRGALKVLLSNWKGNLDDTLLCVGVDTINDYHFCKTISIAKAEKRFLSCSNMEIHSLGFYPHIEKDFALWLKDNFSLPNAKTFPSIMDPTKWLSYNFANNLYILCLNISHIYYYILLREEYLKVFRDTAFRRVDNGR